MTGVAATSFTIEDSTVSFDAEATPGFLSIKGEGGKLLGKLVEKKGKVSGEMTVPLADFKTGIDLRDDHMKNKYLEVKKFPNAKLKVKNLSIEEGDHELVGELTLKGKTNPVKGSYKLKKDGKKYSLRAEFSIVVTDFNIPVPAYAALTVAKEVKINVDAVAAP